MQTHVASVVVRTAASYRYPYLQSAWPSMHSFAQDGELMHGTHAGVHKPLAVRVARAGWHGRTMWRISGKVGENGRCRHRVSWGSSDKMNMRLKRRGCTGDSDDQTYVHSGHLQYVTVKGDVGDLGRDAGTSVSVLC